MLSPALSVAVPTARHTGQTHDTAPGLRRARQILHRHDPDSVWATTTRYRVPSAMNDMRTTTPRRRPTIEETSV
ncbi:hypothetical protein AAW51_4152 [Caldimonas brevitalea]|uniref:Uncharacterized protein n=1 Tax=Caldimonas brevitalea TaxID=413882 RepID=A0A0G3BS78_9BURK|nr:hypothetical protein AAW51_4152 [Caldimonas brevitalea]